LLNQIRVAANLSSSFLWLQLRDEESVSLQIRYILHNWRWITTQVKHQHHI